MLVSSAHPLQINLPIRDVHVIHVLCIRRRLIIAIHLEVDVHTPPVPGNPERRDRAIDRVHLIIHRNGLVKQIIVRLALHLQDHVVPRIIFRKYALYARNVFQRKYIPRTARITSTTTPEKTSAVHPHPFPCSNPVPTRLPSTPSIASATNAKNRNAATPSASETIPPCYLSLGHPAAGFFFSRDFFTASFQSPSILNSSGLGPRLSGAFSAALGMMGNRRFIHESLSFRCLDRQHGTLSVIQLAPVPHEVKLP